ncbi:hypothetical protein TEA_013301 [Camellia sinensis var. sinensis]|uniref:Uncharacterized protein n=1 Tax=Camellia sinensis var. sinensis TaxID=542762 RepID=A0A4S4DPR1_CAMSN|nr:hypothetical protein TEA_013301 [Camellia sinensis var. sinensis]
MAVSKSFFFKSSSNGSAGRNDHKNVTKLIIVIAEEIKLSHQFGYSSSVKKSVTVEKKWGHPVYVVGYNKNRETERLSFISTAISFVTFLGSFLLAKPLEEDRKKEDLETAIKVGVTSLQTKMATTQGNLEAIKKDIGELKEKKFSFKFCEHLDSVLDVVRKEIENCDCLQGKGIRPGTPPDLRHWPAMVSPFCKWNCACNKTLRNYSDSRHPDCEGVSFSMLQKGIQERFQFMVMLLPKPLYIGIDFSCCSRGFLVISISKPAFDTERSQFGSYISNSESHWANREKMGHGRYMSVRGWPFLLGRPH